MFYLVALLIGVLISVMIAINGELTFLYGVFAATVIIHIVGSLFAYLAIKVLGKKITFPGLPLLFYSGGAVGVFVAVANNFSYGKISLTSIIALVLLGQALASILIDSLGLFGMPRHPFQKSSLIGLLFSGAGIAIMLDHSVTEGIYAVILSLTAGFGVVYSRTVNAKLAEKVGDLQGSLINHLVGLPFSVLALALLGAKEWNAFSQPISAQIWIYAGGIFGVVLVMLNNGIVPKVSAFVLTLLIFVGQIFSSIAIDIFGGREYELSSFWGGLLVAAGVSSNLLYDYWTRKKRISSNFPGEK
ncbi:DMT family transporter [Clostridiales bacterium COT073_COT-073]|nr:DMT family transporter [Clostridiales bacterium COT073_COT-073]